MSLYADYAKEQHGRTVLETSMGFISFGVECGVFVIHDLYVIPCHRLGRVGTELANMACAEAINQGFREVWAKIIPGINGQSEAMAAQLAYGFKLVSAGPDFVLLKKELLNG
jgi:L-amino acid N-acyltransferase YncA